MNEQTVLVTGVTGQIGGEVARLLLAAGVRVRGLVKDPSRLPANLAGIELAKGDLGDGAAVLSALTGATSAFFMGPSSPGLAALGGAFFEAAKRAGVARGVVLSSGTVLIPSPTRIGSWHRDLETAVDATGVPVTTLRPGNFASNALAWAAMMRGQGKVFHPNGDAKTTPIDPRDIAKAAVAALLDPKHDGHRYELSGPAVVSAREQVATLSEALEKPIAFVEVPEEGARRGMLGAGVPPEMVEAILELIRASGRGDAKVSPDLRTLLGEDGRTFATWARDFAHAFR